MEAEVVFVGVAEGCFRVHEVVFEAEHGGCGVPVDGEPFAPEGDVAADTVVFRGDAGIDLVKGIEVGEFGVTFAVEVGGDIGEAVFHGAVDHVVPDG
ncbi:MAG: hypothetical protein RI897_2100 [Verrucomicrobiota bacterium]